MMASSISRATISSSTGTEIPIAAAHSAGHENEVAALLKHEDDPHFDLRTLSFRFVFAPSGPPKSAQALENYATNGSGTVLGVR